MGLSVGIVGLPNVGKSTLFNSLSKKQAEAANYAFCTIEPNVGVIPVPDPRFDALVAHYAPPKVVSATIDFVDIAGLVRGASKGEGRGNAFLSNIREADAIAHVVRCFEDDNIVHVDHRVDPAADIETIETELILKDMETVQKRLDRAPTGAKGQNPVEVKAVGICERLIGLLDSGELAAALSLDDADDDERAIVRDMFLLTRKPLFYVCNVNEDQLSSLDTDAHVSAVRERAATIDAPVVVISAKIESEIMQLPEEDRAEFLESVGLTEPGLNRVIQTGYALLDLITFFTAGETEVHAWTITKGTKGPQAGGKIHSDFEKGFIRAEVMDWRDLVDLGSEAAVKSAGKMRLEGKDYVVRDGDVIHIRT